VDENTAQASNSMMNRWLAFAPVCGDDADTAMDQPPWWVSNGRRRRQAKPAPPIMLAVIGVFAFVSGCSRPPGPSPETAALEASLLTVADLEDSFVEESRGQVGISGSKLCTESDFAFEDVGMVRASFVRYLRHSTLRSTAGSRTDRVRENR